MRNAAILLLCSLLITSCASWTAPSAQRLAGEWRYADAKQSCQYIFADDGTFRGSVGLGGKTVSRFTGRWRVEGNRLMYLYTGDAMGRIPPGATDEDKLLAVTAEHFEIQAADGTHRVYVRVR